MEVKDYYAILGVDESASSEQIKSAYRSLALKYHPDRCPEEKKKECEEKFKEIAAAYYVLGDAKRKKEYDDYRKGAYEFRSGQGSGDFASQTGFDFEDLMKHFHDLGARGARQQGGFNRYFFFDDLTDIFEGMSSMQGDQAGGPYTVYNFTDTGGQQKYDTDTYADMKIPRNVALNGGEVKVKLSDARTISLKINPGTKNGQKLRLKGIGKMCPTCDHKGDLIVTIRYS
ncbi:MAG: DnaJ domain-containing protein [Candidatus Omnitrophica bacterium]|nr:DnaJ domain-containing protein [Candidatus Omnitrophota bacterium]